MKRDGTIRGDILWQSFGSQKLIISHLSKLVQMDNVNKEKGNKFNQCSEAQRALYFISYTSADIML